VRNPRQCQTWLTDPIEQTPIRKEWLDTLPCRPEMPELIARAPWMMRIPRPFRRILGATPPPVLVSPRRRRPFADPAPARPAQPAAAQAPAAWVRQDCRHPQLRPVKKSGLSAPGIRAL